MAIGRGAPLRPFVMITPILEDGRPIGGKEQIYKIPYNYLKNFSINYAKDAIGQVEIEFFDISYDNIFVTLTEQIFLNSETKKISYKLRFGWDDNQVVYSGGKISDSGDRSVYNPKKSKDVAVYEQDPNIGSLISQIHVITITDIEYNLTSIGAHVRLKGFNNPPEGLHTMLNMNLPFEGTPKEVIDQVCKKVRLNPEWKVSVDEFDKQKNVGILWSKNKYNCNNKMVGDILKDLLQKIIYKGKADKLYFYIYYEILNNGLVIPKIIFDARTDDIVKNKFLGTYKYFYGKESTIINTLSFNLENYLMFFASIESRTKDPNSKKEIEATSDQLLRDDFDKVDKVVSSNKYVQADQEARDLMTKKELVKQNRLTLGQIASASGTTFPGLFLTADEQGMVDDAVRRSIYNFVIQASMTIIGEPILDFTHIGMQSYLELEVYKTTGEKIDMFSGLYAIDSLSHEINETSFVTNLSMIKYSYTDDIVTQRSALGLENPPENLRLQGVTHGS